MTKGVPVRGPPRQLVIKLTKGVPVRAQGPTRAGSPYPTLPQCREKVDRARAQGELQCRVP